MADAFDDLDFEYVTGVAEKAMRAVTEQRVPPTPQNFHVWFKYALGSPVELKRTIDILVANKRKFDSATSRDLYTTYVGSVGGTLGGNSERSAPADLESLGPPTIGNSRCLDDSSMVRVMIVLCCG